MTPVKLPGLGPLLQQLHRLLIGIAAVDDQRQAREPRRRDMLAEDGALAIARTVLVVIVEAGFADADHLGMGR